MGGAERVVLALGAPGEAGQAAGLAQGADAVAPAGDDLVRVALVADVPDHPVMRGVEHGVQRHRQLHHAQAGAEMAARGAHRIDRLGTQLVRHLAQLLGRKIAQVGRNANTVQQRGRRARRKDRGVHGRHSHVTARDAGERPVGPLHDGLHPGLGLGELGLAVLAQQGAPFIGGDGVLQLLLPALQPFDDPLQFGQRVLERQAGDVLRHARSPSVCRDYAVAAQATTRRWQRDTVLRCAAGGSSSRISRRTWAAVEAASAARS